MNTKYYINAAISILIMALFRFIPPFGAMTAFGMTVLGIFIGTLWGWITCDMVWPSVIGLILLGFSGYMDNCAAVFTSTISNPTVQLILWLLVFSALLTTTGISKQLVNRLVNSKMSKGHPWVLSFVICFAVWICASFGAGFAAILICWSLVYTISEQVGYTKNDTWPKMMVCAIPFFNALGAMALPFQGGVVAVFGYLGKASEGQYGAYNYVSYLIFSLLFCASVMVIYVLFAKFIIRPDMSKLQNPINVGEIEPFDTKQKIALGALAAMMILTILPSCLPAGPVKMFMNKIGTTAIVLFIVVFVTFLRNKEGKPFFTFKDLANNGVLWPMLFMVATATTLGGALAAQNSGFTGTIMQLFNPIFSGASPFVFSVVIIVATMCLTNVINNSVASAIMVPVMYPFAQKIGANPVVLTALICFAANCGLLLPCASPAGAMLHGNKEWVDTKTVVLYSLLGIMAMTLMAIVVGIPLGSALFK